MPAQAQVIEICNSAYIQRSPNHLHQPLPMRRPQATSSAKPGTHGQSTARSESPLSACSKR